MIDQVSPCQRRRGQTYPDASSHPFMGSRTSSDQCPTEKKRKARKTRRQDAPGDAKRLWSIVEAPYRPLGVSHQLAHPPDRMGQCARIADCRIKDTCSEKIKRVHDNEVRRGM